MSLSIRPAQQEDTLIAALLLADTTGAYGVQVLGLGKPDLQVKAMQTWFSHRGNRFSFEQSWIAEKYSIAAGLLTGFPGADLNVLELGCGRQIVEIYGLWGAIRMVWRNYTLVHHREAGQGEYLIAHLVVDEHFRRQGIAQALLAKAEEEARAKGISKLVLEVEIGNDKAIALYRKAGFTITATIPYNDKTGVLKFPGFYKMLKNL